MMQEDFDLVAQTGKKKLLPVWVVFSENEFL